ncbi:hypothetical protein B0H11DRAFT_2376236 [Mycena galericulata]|nr:hypothetical protein B0H11DRAFT_2376236 [Mycena galericulata]
MARTAGQNPKAREKRATNSRSSKSELLATRTRRQSAKLRQSNGAGLSDTGSLDQSSSAQSSPQTRARTKQQQLEKQDKNTSDSNGLEQIEADPEDDGDEYEEVLEEEEDEVLEEEEEDDKRQRERVKKSRKQTPSEDETIEIEDDEDEEGDEELPAKRAKKRKLESDVEESVEILYNISIFKGPELRKPPKKRVAAHNGFLNQSNDVPYYKFEKNLFEKITSLTKRIVEPDDEGTKLTFTIPRHVVAPLEIDDQTTYKHMTTMALKCKDPTVNIVVELEEADMKGRDAEDSPNKKKSKLAGKKTKVCVIQCVLGPYLFPVTYPPTETPSSEANIA